ncbi:MAG: VWA domain-containing protein, partial [Deltaproteobacteria bacterium]|nr:VWA domain-containing protein [Deltaproteobacteria bacterium]
MSLPHMYTPTPRASAPSPSPAGCRLVAADGRELPLRGAELRVDACAGMARVVLEQRFVNPYDEPLTVTYQLPLPADGAVSGFAFTLGETRVVGEIDRREDARERFEEALIEGRSAALLEQDRTSLFTQEVGNIPAGEEISAEVVVDQPLTWLADGHWEWRFPTVVAPRYLGAAGRVVDAESVSVDVADRALDAAVALELRVRDAVRDGGRPSSPSHPIVARPSGDALQVTLSDDSSSSFDRDVVVRWPVASAEPGVSLDRSRPEAEHARSDSAFGLLTIVPPLAERKGASVPRDLIVLIDTSGSMGGQPLDQAKRVVTALIDGLAPEDQLELIEFSWRPKRFKKRPVPASPRNKAAAIAWVKALSASGGTEMRDGIVAALGGLRPEAQRQVLLISDGLIGFEEEIVAEILHRLPPGCRVHTLGVGSAVNRSLTGPAARAGAGCEICVAPDEDVEPLMKRLLQRMQEPLVVDLQLAGTGVRSTATSRLPDLFAGAPALLPVELSPDGGAIVIRGRTAAGSWTHRVDVPATEPGAGNAAVAALYARERVEDLEVRRAADEPGAPIDEQIEALGLAFGIATRLTSWVAISETATVDPTRASRKVTQPQQLPHGMSAEGLGLRPAARAMAMTQFGQAGMLGAVMPMPMAPPPPGAGAGYGRPPAGP